MRIQFPAQSFHVQQRLLQQDQLRLDLHVEATGDLEQAQQDLAERDVLERPVEDRLAHRAHGRFHLIHPRVGRHPARFQVQGGHAPVVAIEDRQKVLCQVMLVPRIERTHDAEVHGRIAWVFRIVDRDEDISRVHVGVKEVMAEHLGEKYLHPVLGQPADVGAGGPQPGHVADGHAVYALHDHDVQAAIIPIHLGHVQQVRPLEITLQLRGVRRLAHQIQLIENRLFVLGHDLARTQAAPFAPEPLRQIRNLVQDFQVALDPLAHAGTQHFDDDFLTVRQPGDMHLCDRSGRQRRRVELRKHFGDRLPVRALDDGASDLSGERRNTVLKPRQFVGDIDRQQVPPGGDGLAEFHENRPQFLERQPQTLAASRRSPAFEPDTRR